MRILSPVDNITEVDALVDAGADELYCGYVPRDWVSKYSLLGSANHRYFKNAQVGSMKELSKIVRAAHTAGADIFFTLNAPGYLPSQYDDLVGLAARVRDIGMDALIVADIGLMLRLRDGMPEAPVHLSTLAPVFNTAASAFYAALGAMRQVLPRELTLAETRLVVSGSPGIEFDTFIMVGKCPNVEGFCSFTHNDPDMIWPCEQKYDIEVIKGDARSADIVDAVGGWSRVNRRQACGLCAVPGLMGAGVTALKLVGRGGPTAMKLKAIHAVREVVTFAESGASEDEAATRAMEIYHETFGCACNRYVCYFPEMWGGGVG